MSWVSDKRVFVCYLTLIIIINIFMGGSMPAVHAGQEGRQTLVLDSGHGGRDTGAKGQNGVFEKTVVLTLARVISEEIGSRYRVVLTRTGDYWLDLPDRAAVANHERADLFISLHTGASFYHQTNGISVFYSSGPPHVQTDADKESDMNAPGSFIPWDAIQFRHLQRSRDLARAIHLGLQDRSHGLEVSVRGAPLLLLSGVDAPAILLEVGYLTNAGEEKRLKDRYYLRDLAKGIILGIDAFLH